MLVDLDPVVDHDAARLTFQKVADGKAPSLLGERDDDAVGLELLGDLLEVLDGAEERIARGKIVGLLVHHANHDVAELGLRLDLGDQPERHRARAQDHDALLEGPTPEESVGQRAQRQEHADGEEHTRQDRPLGHPRAREDAVEPGQQDEGDAEGLQQPRDERVEAVDDPEVVQIVVVKSDDAAERQRQGLADDGGDVEPTSEEGLRPSEDGDADCREEDAPLDQGQHRGHGLAICLSLPGARDRTARSPELS